MASPLQGCWVVAVASLTFGVVVAALLLKVWWWVFSSCVTIFPSHGRKVDGIYRGGGGISPLEMVVGSLFPGRRAGLLASW